jgi:hypothetical protein
MMALVARILIIQVKITTQANWSFGNLDPFGIITHTSNMQTILSGGNLLEMLNGFNRMYDLFNDT